MGISCVFMQDNHFLSVPAFTLRGLRFQTPLAGQDKLVRCIKGRIYDVAVDVRRGSLTYGQGSAPSFRTRCSRALPISTARSTMTAPLTPLA